MSLLWILMLERVMKMRVDSASRKGVVGCRRIVKGVLDYF